MRLSPAKRPWANLSVVGGELIAIRRGRRRRAGIVAGHTSAATRSLSAGLGSCPQDQSGSGTGAAGHKKLAQDANYQRTRQDDRKIETTEERACMSTTLTHR